MVFFDAELAEVQSFAKKCRTAKGAEIILPQRIQRRLDAELAEKQRFAKSRCGFIVFQRIFAA